MKQYFLKRQRIEYELENIFQYPLFEAFTPQQAVYITGEEAAADAMIHLSESNSFIRFGGKRRIPSLPILHTLALSTCLGAENHTDENKLQPLRCQIQSMRF